MKNIIISTIKYGIVMGAGLLSFAQTSLAATVLTPAVASGVSRTSAILVARVMSDGWNNTTVWFEWGETTALGNPIVGFTKIPYEGDFQGFLSNLKPGTTYYFRAVAMERDGNKVTSPVTNFTTDGGVAPSVTTSATEQPVVTTKSETQTTAPAQTAKTTTSVSRTTTPAAKTTEATPKTAEVAVAPAKTTVSSVTTNANIASVIGAGDGVLPGTLIGWLLLFIAILIAVIIIHTIHLQNVQRKKALEAKAKMVPVAAVA